MVGVRLFKMVQSVPSVKLSNGFSIPAVGLGTWLSKPGEVTEAVKTAIDAGYRHIDCATVYENEAEVGAGIRAKIEDGTVKREDMFITTKLWNTFHSEHLVVPAIKESLSKLGLDFLDLFLLHWPMGYQEGGELFPKDENGKMLYSDVDYVEPWKEMEECLHQGLTKSIGLSNFNKDQIERILSVASVPPVVLQIESHPYLNQKKLIQFCKSKNIVVTTYSPLGSPNRPWAKPGDPSLLEDPKLKEIAEKYNKSTAQVLIKYQVQRGVVPIPKSVTENRIITNIQVFDFELSDEDLAVIDSFDCNGRFLHLSWVSDHPHYPFHAEF